MVRRRNSQAVSDFYNHYQEDSTRTAWLCDYVLLPSPVLISAILPWCGTWRDQLHVKVAHLHGAPAGLADYGKSLRQQLVESCVFGCPDLIFVFNSIQLGRDFGPEFSGLVTQLLVG